MTEIARVWSQSRPRRVKLPSLTSKDVEAVERLMAE